MRYAFRSSRSDPLIPVRNGISTRTPRGQIGQTWWGRRWLEPFEESVARPVLDNGRKYARKGQILSITVTPGDVRAVVQGSREEPYECNAQYKTVPDDEWTVALEKLSASSLPVAHLLANRMPENIEEYLGLEPHRFFPDFAPPADCFCECINGGRFCKHLAAVYYILAERFDEDPFLLFKLRGLDTQVIRDHWREQWGIKPESETTVATVEEGATPQPFYGGDVEPLIDLEQQPIQRLDVLNRLGMPTFLPARDETSIGALRRFYD